MIPGGEGVARPYLTHMGAVIGQIKGFKFVLTNIGIGRCFNKVGKVGNLDKSAGGPKRQTISHKR